MNASTKLTEQPATGNKFEELDVLRSVDGLKAVISLRRDTGVITFAVVKVFERGGSEQTTSFIPETLIDSYLEMVENVAKRIAELRKDPRVMNAARRGLKHDR